MTKKRILELLNENKSVISKLSDLTDEIELVISKIIECFESGKKIIIFGNGGSAADSQHLAAEFVGRFKYERKSLPAISLTTDTSIITALGNDYGFDSIFSRQCEAIVENGDVVIAISTSGKSRNILEGVLTCKSRGSFIMGFTGLGGDDLSKLCDVSVIVPSNSTPRIQEGHRVIFHIICEIVEDHFKNT